MNLEFDDPREPHDDQAPLSRLKFKFPRAVLLGAGVVALIILAYFGYSYFTGIDQAREEAKPKIPPRIIQLDVLNGCGAKGVGSRFTEYLRANGFDVVEMKNYKSFQVRQTLVVDRIGDLALARSVAKALGVDEKNVIQQLNPDYFVDLSVIIGKDYQELKVPHQ